MQDFSISLNKSSTTISDGNTETLTATTDPAGETVTWSSSDEDVATVAAGVVTAVDPGTAIITASFTKGGVVYSANCVVTVTA